MSIQIYQLLTLVIYVTLIVAFWKIKSKNARIVIVVIGFIAFATSPLRHKQEGAGGLERSINRFESVPNKIVVERPVFEDRQKQQFNSLKNDSENMKDEIHN